MPRPVCKKCSRLFEVVTLGAVVQFDAHSVGGAYEQWHCDGLRCPGCGTEIFGQYAAQASWNHFEAPAKQPEVASVTITEFIRPLGAR